MTMLLQLGVYLVKEWKLKKKRMWKITGLAVNTHKLSANCSTSRKAVYTAEKYSPSARKLLETIEPFKQTIKP